MRPPELGECRQRRVRRRCPRGGHLLAGGRAAHGPGLARLVRALHRRLRPALAARLSCQRCARRPVVDRRAARQPLGARGGRAARLAARVADARRGALRAPWPRLLARGATLARGARGGGARAAGLHTLCTLCLPCSHRLRAICTLYAPCTRTLHWLCTLATPSLRSVLSRWGSTSWQRQTRRRSSGRRSCASAQGRRCATRAEQDTCVPAMYL